MEWRFYQYESTRQFLGCSFHPELTDDHRITAYFVKLVENHINLLFEPNIQKTETCHMVGFSILPQIPRIP